MTDTTEPTAPDVANPSYWAKTLVTVRDKLDDALAAENADTIFESIYGKLKRKREEIALGMLGVVKRDYDGKVRWEIDPFTRERTPASLSSIVTAKAQEAANRFASEVIDGLEEIPDSVRRSIASKYEQEVIRKVEYSLRGKAETTAKKIMEGQLDHIVDEYLSEQNMQKDELAVEAQSLLTTLPSYTDKRVLDLLSRLGELTTEKV